MDHLVCLLQDVLSDLRSGIRQLRRNPLVSIVCVLTLALGIGANAAIFSVVEQVLLRTLPFKNADRLVDLTEYKSRGVESGGVSFPDYLEWRQENTVFEETAAYFLINASNDIVLGGPFSTERERYSTVTNSFFSILGVDPTIGHGFTPADEIPGAAKVFLISDAVWRGVFGGDPQAIGKPYLLDGETYTLLGVMPRGFDFPKGCGVWVPTSTLGASGFRDRLSHAYHVLGRLRPGTNPSQAKAQVETIQIRLAKAYPDTDADWHVSARPLLNEVVGNVGRSLFVLLGAVAFILLIACTNVVNLMLARASAREKEFAIRTALGAGRARLLRQNLTEVSILVGLSIVLAVVFAKWGLALAVSLTSVLLPRMEAFHLNLPVLLFLAAVAGLTTLLVGFAPTLRRSPIDPQIALRDAQRGSGSSWQGQRLRDGLVVSEIALATLLLCGAGLTLRSFVKLVHVNPGFQPEHLLTMKIALPGGTYSKSEQTAAYLDQLLARLQALPGVQSAAAASTLPMSGESDWGTFQIVGNATPDWSKALAADWRGVSANYFQTLEIPLLHGREFLPTDGTNHNSLMINAALANKFWPGSDPVGQKILRRDGRDPLEIIGVVANVQGNRLGTEARPEMYTPLRGFWYAFLVLRTKQDPSSLASVVRERVAALDKGVPVYQVAMMDQLLSSSVSPERFNLLLLSFFASLALVLAACGVYGVLAFGVSRRTHEIGVRLALGARQTDIFRLILRRGMTLVLLGTALGLAGAAVLTRLMSSLLYGVSTIDPATFLAVTALLVIVSLIACFVPARRAMQVDPTVALRCE
ncbi:MAG: ABC transporter permease [Candidatus Acidiferrum sp.]